MGFNFRASLGVKYTLLRRGVKIPADDDLAWGSVVSQRGIASNPSPATKFQSSVPPMGAELFCFWMG